MFSKTPANRIDIAGLKPQSQKLAAKNRKTPDRRQTHPATKIQQAGLGPGTPLPGDIRQLQRTIGNQAVFRILTQTAHRQPLANLQRKGLGDIEGVKDVAPTGEKRNLIGTKNRKVQVYQAKVERNKKRWKALTQSAEINAKIGEKTQDQKWSPPGVELPTGKQTKTLDPFFLDTRGSYGPSSSPTELILSYQHANKFQGYVTRVKDAGKEAEMTSSLTAEGPKRYGHAHKKSKELKLITLIGPDQEKDAVKEPDAYTKIAGEGARWKCVRDHGTELRDRTIFYTTKGYPRRGEVWGVLFKQLWTTWERTFKKKYNIPNKEVVKHLKDNTLKNKDEVPLGKAYSQSGIHKTKDYNLDS